MQMRWLGSPFCQAIFLHFPLLCLYLLFSILCLHYNFKKAVDHLLFYCCTALSVVAGAYEHGELYGKELWRMLLQGGLTAYRFVESSQEVNFICQRICFGLQLDLVHVSTIHILKKRKPKISDETTGQRGFRTPVGPSFCFQVCNSLGLFLYCYNQGGGFFHVMLDVY